MERLCAPMYAQKLCEEPRCGAGNSYNPRVVHRNWYEERRQFQQLCSRCTGHSITKTDFLPYCAEDYIKVRCLPPPEYAAKRAAEGEGFKMFMNTDDYCDYLENYTTTNDLMYNWEVRRAGVKEKPFRKWKMIFDAAWMPQPDNALSYGNLTQYGYRQSPQLPLVPNDWKTYDMDTTYKVCYTPHRYPDNYTLTRYAAPKCVRREVDDMVMVRKPGQCECCRFWLPKHPKDNDAKVFPGHGAAFVGNVPRFHPSLVPGHTVIPKFPVQSVYPPLKGIQESLKHPPHPAPVPGEPILESMCPGPCDTKEFCFGVADALTKANFSENNK